MTLRHRFLTVLATVVTAGAVAIAPPALAAETGDAYLPSAIIGRLSTTGTEYSVAVEKTGTYKIQFQIDYPTGVVVLHATVDGNKLPSVRSVTPPGSQRFASFAYSAHLDLCRGTHLFVVRASRIPSPVGVRADLMDARIIEIE